MISSWTSASITARRPRAPSTPSRRRPPGPICGSNVVIFTPEFANAPFGDPGHLIVVEFSGPAGVNFGSLTRLDPRGTGSRIARDRGDGRYAIDVGGFGDGTGTFTIYADDQATPQTFQVGFFRAC